MSETFTPDNLPTPHLTYPENNTSLKEIANLIDIEAKGIDTQTNICYEEFATIAAMQYVNASISGYRQKVVNELESFLEYEGDLAEKAWHFSAGYCGSKVYAMMEILNFLEIDTREIQFWHINNEPYSHVAIEVYYSNNWHYYDPTWGMFFRKETNVLSLEEILSIPKEEAYKYLMMNSSNVQNSVTDFRTSIYNPLETTFDLGIAGNATIKFDFDQLSTLASTPGYIGICPNQNMDLSETKYGFLIRSGISKIEINFDTSSTTVKSLLIKNEDGDLYDAKNITDNAQIILNISDMDFPIGNYLILETADKEEINLFFIDQITIYYKNGTVKEIQ